jgi:hypothetical protein
MGRGESTWKECAEEGFCHLALIAIPQRETSWSLCAYSGVDSGAAENVFLCRDASALATFFHEIQHV